MIERRRGDHNTGTTRICYINTDLASLRSFFERLCEALAKHPKVNDVVFDGDAAYAVISGYYRHEPIDDEKAYALLLAAAEHEYGARAAAVLARLSDRERKDLLAGELEESCAFVCEWVAIPDVRVERGKPVYSLAEYLETFSVDRLIG